MRLGGGPQGNGLQQKIDSAYQDTWDGVEVEIPAEEEGGEVEDGSAKKEVTKETFRGMTEAAFAQLGRDRPRVGHLSCDPPA